MKMNRLKCLTNGLNRTKAWKNEDEPIKNSKEEDEPNKSRKKAKEPNRSARKRPKTCFKSLYGHGKWMNKMEKRRKLMWLESLEENTPLGGCKAPRWVRCRHLRLQVCSQDKTREEKTQVSQMLTNFGRVSVLTILILHLEGPKPSLYRRRTGHEVYKAYTTS